MKPPLFVRIDRWLMDAHNKCPPGMSWQYRLLSWVETTLRRTRNRWQAIRYRERHMCPSRDNGYTAAMFPGPDRWHRQPNGDRTCSYCGSMHEDDFTAVINKIIDGVDGYRLDHSDKQYKVYVKQPGIRNASEGAIKFYKWHVDKDHPDFPERTERYKRALEISKRLYDEWFSAWQKDLWKGKDQ